MGNQTGRSEDIFLNREQLKLMKESNAKKRFEKEKVLRDRAAEEFAQPIGQEKDLHFKVNFKYKDHKQVVLMKPFMNQMITDMVRHANDLNPPK